MRIKTVSNLENPAVGEGNGNPLQYSCLENPMDRGPGGLQSMGSQRVRHDCSDLARTHAVLVTSPVRNSGKTWGDCLLNERRWTISPLAWGHLYSIHQGLLFGGDFISQGTSGDIWRCFGCHSSHSPTSISADTANHPPGHGTPQQRITQPALSVVLGLRNPDVPLLSQQQQHTRLSPHNESKALQQGPQSLSLYTQDSTC